MCEVEPERGDCVKVQSVSLFNITHNLFAFLSFEHLIISWVLPA